MRIKFLLCAMVTALAAVSVRAGDWTWKGPDEGLTSDAANWTIGSGTTTNTMWFKSGAYNKTIIIDELYEITGEVQIGGESSPDPVTVVLKAKSDDCGIISTGNDGLRISAYNNICPTCTLRIEGGTYQFGLEGHGTSKTGSGILLGGDYANTRLEFVSGEIVSLGSLLLHLAKVNKVGEVVVGDGRGDTVAHLEVRPSGVTLLCYDGSNNALTLRKGGILETCYIVGHAKPRFAILRG